MAPLERSQTLPAIAALGALDVAAFLWERRRTMFREAPGRAGGSLGGLALWTALAVSGAAAPGRLPTRSLAWICGVSNLALYGVHLKIGKGRVRGLPGAVLGVAAVAAAG